MIKKLEHIGVYVNDMDESILFYEQVLGLQLVKRMQLDNGLELSFLSYPETDQVQIELIGRGTDGMSDAGIVHHIAFTVTDIEVEVERIRKLGIRLLDEEPRAIADGIKVAFFFGPNGERLEFFQAE